jgi:hypothetical protein
MIKQKLGLMHKNSVKKSKKEIPNRKRKNDERILHA